MTFQHFLESFFSRLRRDAATMLPGDPRVAPPLAALGKPNEIVPRIEEAPLFHLGDWDEIANAMKEHRAELVEDLADGLLAPFPSIVMSLQGVTGWRLEWLCRTGEGAKGDRFVHLGFHEKHLEPIVLLNAIEFEYAGKVEGRFLVHILPETVNRHLAVDSRPLAEVAGDLGRIVENAMFRVALISHAANYIVERSPRLTPREARKMIGGEPRPLRKRPHFIVIDSEGLSELRQDALSIPHQSPMPHARRGHWMRLSERCRLARSQGRMKTWVRETYVGDLEFSDDGNRYRVFLTPHELQRESTRIVPP
jgi:hypothetical protein